MKPYFTLAAIIAATALVFHAPHAKAQSTFIGPSAFSKEAVEALFTIQVAAWSAACTLSKMDCKLLPPPRVAYGLLPGMFGSYKVGSSTVLIDIRLLAQQVATVVMVHEMVHYIQDRKRPLHTGVTTREQICADEKEAHELAEKFVALSGIAKGDTRVHKWENVAYKYGCLKP